MRSPFFSGINPRRIIQVKIIKNIKAKLKKSSKRFAYVLPR
jgi:hypothetical protein